MLDAHFQYSTVFDNANAHRDLGFEHMIPFRKAVERTIEWIQANRGIDAWDMENDDGLITAWRENSRSFLGRISDS